MVVVVRRLLLGLLEVYVALCGQHELCGAIRRSNEFSLHDDDGHRVLLTLFYLSYDMARRGSLLDVEVVRR